MLLDGSLAAPMTVKSIPGGSPLALISTPYKQSSRCCNVDWSIPKPVRAVQTVLLYLLRNGPAVTSGSSMDSTGALTLSVPVIVLQVQKLKVDLESAMLEIDQILRANELSISLVAAVPAILIAGATLTLLWRLCSPKMPDPKRQAVPCR